MGFNFLNLMFLSFTFIITTIGGLLIFIGPYLPEFLPHVFLYGKLSNKGKSSGKRNNWLKRFELPKSYFKHFYGIAIFFSYLALYLILKGIISSPIPLSIIDFLDLIASKERTVQIDSTSALIAIFLTCMHCTRRCYETCKLQIFSSKSKINLWHYLTAYFHYFGISCAILTNTEGFVRETHPSDFDLRKLTILKYLCIGLFYYAWNAQYRSNMILVNGRKDKNGTIITESHVVPNGGAFKLVSSPHMLFEIVMYCAIWGILPNSTTWFYCTIWVTINQIIMAWFVHKWYLDNFPNYPQERRAIIPFII